MDDHFSSFDGIGDYDHYDVNQSEALINNGMMIMNDDDDDEKHEVVYEPTLVQSPPLIVVECKGNNNQANDEKRVIITNVNKKSDVINNKQKKIKKHRYAFQTRSQVDILDDGYRWRKYGQKAVKNNNFPRSYYRCTHEGCNVKKQVQRLSKDEGVVVTTYEGIHSHSMHTPTDNFQHILSVLGSILAKQGRVPGVSDVLSGALKVVLKPIKQNDSAPATSKPRNNALIAQVNSLRQELQLLASSRSMTIVTSSRTGGRRVGVIIVIVVIGYGYAWWKVTLNIIAVGCPNVIGLTFCLTSLFGSSVCSTFGWSWGLRCNLTLVFSAQDTLHVVRFRAGRLLSGKLTYTTLEARAGNFPISCLPPSAAWTMPAIQYLISYLVLITLLRQGTKKDTSSRLDESSCKVEEIVECTSITRDEAAAVKGRIINMNEFLQALSDRVQTLDPSSDASRHALEHPRVAVPSRTVSLPAALPSELPSPSTSNRSSEINGLVGDTVSAVENASSLSVSNGNHVTPQPVRSVAMENGLRFHSESPTDTVPAVENASSPSVSNGDHVTPQPGRSAGFLSRWFSFSNN
ncbi:hypothetical protein KSS87_018513 [Heliosperma pusillum]|nr:hypothetical protein KSS87_018513 [Heliosperma pusillum]